MRIKRTPQKIISEIYRNPRYRGKHVIIVAGKIFASKTGRGKSRLLQRLVKEHPRSVPTVTYVPKEDTLILFS